MADYDKKHCTADKYGNLTANDQKGIDKTATPITSDNKKWQFGDSLANVTPTKIA